MKSYYINLNSIFILFLLVSSVTFSQNYDNPWSRISKEEVTQEKLFSKTEATTAVFYSLNLEGLKTALHYAPLRGGSFQASNLIIEFPDSQGNLIPYYIKEAPVLEESLQLRFPNIRSYIGVATNNPKNSMRFSLSLDGFHAAIYRTNNGTQFIDPYTKDRNSYIVYATKDLPSIESNFVCDFENTNEIDRSIDTENTSRFNDGNLRTFRLALACTGEYSQFHLTQQGVGAGETDAVKKAAVLSAMNTTMTRVNGVYENELSLTMTLVDDTSIIYLDGTTDPYTNNDGGAMLTENQTTLDTNIGSSNYDIGHVFSTGGGGVAYLNSPCNAGSKAGGVTGLSSPIGDVFDIDFVSHEMGHQFGANHTFNGDEGNCGGGNRNNATAFEPGSGSTIMGYAGICGSQNVQNNSNDYFHVSSLNEIWANITTGVSTCASLSSTGNNSPTINTLVNYTIPKSTPFILKGNGDDPDGAGTLTYCWEQKDNTISMQPPVSSATDGPSFRSVTPSSSTDRYVPAIESVLGIAPTTWEVLPSVARTLNFDLTVRDNDVSGRFTTESMVVTVEDVAPFLVTEPSIAVVWGVGTTHTVSWDVGSTTNGTINCQNVNIKLSTDGGLTYPITILANTTNDGTEDIVIPNNMSTTCRIMVESIGNIFYNITNVDFTIAADDGTPDYCPSTFTNPGSEYISNVTFNTINNNSGDAATGGYEDFTGINTDVELNTAYQIDVEINTVGNFEDNCEVYIDWNQDFIFDTATEKYFLGSVTNVSAGVLSQSITIPSGATIGNTRMRVNIEFASNPTVPGPCNIDHITEWGETEDYTLNIVNPLGVNDVLFKNFNVFPNPNDGNFTISFQSGSNKKVKVTLYDILGRTITNQTFNSNNEQFNQKLHFKNLSQGIYLLKISQENKITSKQLIIN